MNIDGHEIIETLHDSSNSLVLRAVRTADGARNVLKLLKRDYPSAVELTRYRREYELVRFLDVDGVIAAESLEKYENTLLMTLEDLGAESLEKHMRDAPFSLREVLDIATKLSATLAEVHRRQIVHKDVNPTNVVLNRDTGEVRLIDFGIATKLTRERPILASPGVLEGTLAYMSPEQTGRTSRSLDYRTDLYSFGATLYYLATGRRPFESDDPVTLVHCQIAKLPVPSHQVNPAVPPALSQIIARLMAKEAEARYQSAAGVLDDLELCARALDGDMSLVDFTPGRTDFAEHFKIPQKLYGREAQLRTLLETFHRVSAGSSELMLISGYSGVGKTALVREICGPITQMRGYFVSGKFDQLQRTVPFSAFVSALSDLVRQLLTEDEARLDAWRRELQDAFGPNGQVIVDVIPDIELIVGPQELVPELGPAETLNRFNLVLLSFIRVFCGGGRPLVIFLDDLQWADRATLKLLRLLTDDETENLLLIGAYRDHEVDAMHPLTTTIEELRQAGRRVSEIKLRPLSLENLCALVADTLGEDRRDVLGLAELVLAKTRGNPFFVGQFLETLYHEHLLTRMPTPEGRTRWRWDLERIAAADITDNVVELMIGKLRKLPAATQDALRLAACIGNRFDLETLALVHEVSLEQTHADLFPALRDALIVPSSAVEALDPREVMSPLLIRHYKFQHDRVQQSAYALFAEDELQAIHLEIGRRFVETMDSTRLGEKLFEVVDHLDIGRALIEEPQELQRLAELNLDAGKKALEATAWSAARDYVLIANDALDEDSWSSAYELTTGVLRLLAEVEYLNSNFERADELIDLLLDGVRTDLERAEILCMRVMQSTMRLEFDAAFDCGQRLMGLLGYELPLENLDQLAQAGLARIAETLGSRDVASLRELPNATDPRVLLAQHAVRHLTIAAFLANQALFPVVTALSVNLTLEHGHAPESALSFANYGLILGAFMGRYAEGYEFGQLGLALCDRFVDAPVATVCLVAGSELIAWVDHVKHTLPVFERGYHRGLELGDILWSGYLVMYKVSHETFMGKNIQEILAALPDMLAINMRSKNFGALDGMRAHQLVLSNLAGYTDDHTIFASDEFDEAGYLAQCDVAQSLCFYRILKAQALYLYGDYAGSLALTRSVDDMLNYIVNHVQLAEHRLYQSLALTALYADMDEDEQRAARDVLEANEAQLRIWAAACPANCAHKHLLVRGEVARLDGDHIEALDCYDRAHASAQEHEFLQDQALANELAARYWLTRERGRRMVTMHLLDARYAYELWGAERKVELLEAEFPEHLGRGARETRGLPIAPRTTTTTTGEDLDLASVLKATQAISQPIALAQLLSDLVRVVLENAGAQRGVIVLENEGEWLIEAAGSVEHDDLVVDVLQGEALVDINSVCTGIVHYVINTKQTVVLNDAAVPGRFSVDPYMIERAPKSVLCTPLLQQGRVSGVVYLENNLSAGTFTEDRLGVLRVLASQAAISLENAKLYSSLAAYSQTLEQKVEERTRAILRTQNQLIAQQKLAWMGELSVGVAHEIKNPLNFINNFAELSSELSSELHEELRRKQGTVLSAADYAEIGEIIADIQTNVATILHHGRRVNGIVESIQLLSEGGSKGLSSTAINQHVEGFLTLVQNVRMAKHEAMEVEIRRAYDENIGEQVVAAHDFGRAVANLLHNAFEAMAEKRARDGQDYRASLVIATLDLDDSFEIKVHDNGVGIAPEHIDDIYSPFFTTKPAGSGHIGLGLAIANDVVTLQHHGELSIETAEGDYTQFTIHIPKRTDRSMDATRGRSG